MTAGRQLALLDDRPSASWAADSGGDHGEVFTRPWVVDMILDLVGYTVDIDLGSRVIVEPSCGSGAFLGRIAARVASSAKLHGRPLSELGTAVRAFDLLERNAEAARKAVMAVLLDQDATIEAAEYLSAAWVRTGDFLLTDHEEGSVDFVVGNPPYIRLEDVPTFVSDAYRSECLTMRGRADVYVGFFEKGLGLLNDGGKLGFICADRWMRNQYGAELRSLVSDRYSVDSVTVMHDVDAFEAPVSAYPAITVIRNGPQGPARVVEASATFDEAAGQAIVAWASASAAPAPLSDSFEAGELAGWFPGSDHWPSGSPRTLELIADLEHRFRPLEDIATGTRVGIGVASGCDDVYITRDASLVEDDRLLPLAMASDLAGGSMDWGGRYLVNPWNGRGLVDLGRYPQLRAHFEGHAQRLRARHTARKQPERWYRTIDVVDPTLLKRPKLLLPDIKAAAHPVLDTGQVYPHHNLYFVVSDGWDLEALGGILLSDIANLFVGAYCVKMRGGCYRFQAQYLRKIRVPPPTSIDESVVVALRDAFRSRDVAQATQAALRAYGLERTALSAN